MPSYTSADTARPADRATPAGQEPADDFLAAVLIRMWALASGRSLRRDVPPAQLSEEELIDFWADDMSSPIARHARPGEPDRTPGTEKREKTARRAPRPRRRKRGRAHGRPQGAITNRREEYRVSPAAA